MYQPKLGTHFRFSASSMSLPLVLVGLNGLTGLQLLLWLLVALLGSDFSSPIAPDTVFQKLLVTCVHYILKKAVECLQRIPMKKKN